MDTYLTNFQILLEAENSKYVLFGLIGVLSFLVLWQVLNMKYLFMPLKVRKMDISCFKSLDHVDKSERNVLIQSLFDMCVDQVQTKLVPTGKISSVEDKLTMYSLYKQAEDGNAPLESEHTGPKD